MPVDVISERPSSDKSIYEIRIETQRTRGVDPSWELWETAGGQLCRMRLEPSDGSIVFETNDGAGGGWIDAGELSTGSSGDVVGPGSSTDNALARFDSTTGKLLQNSNTTLADNGGLTLTAAAATEVLGTFVAHASQSANLSEWKSSGGTVGARVTASREFSNSSGGSNSEAFGSGATAGASSTAFGKNASGGSSAGVAVGINAAVIGASGTAIGTNASAAVFGTAVGNGATNSGSGISFGRNASGPWSVGYAATSVHSTSMSLGTSANATTTGSMAFGASSSSTHVIGLVFGPSATSTAANQLVFGSSWLGTGGYQTMYVGQGVVSTVPIATTITSSGGSGTDIAGANLLLAAGKPTGAGTAGDLLFQTSAAGATGTTLRSLTTRMAVKGTTGSVGIGTTTPASGGGYPCLIMADAGSDPTGISTNCAGVFAKDVSGTTEFFAIDEGGAATQLTQHAKDGPDSIYTNSLNGKGREWVSRRQIPWKGIDGKALGHRSETIDGAVIWENPKNGKVAVESFLEYSQRMGYLEEEATRLGYVAIDWDEVQTKKAQASAADRADAEAAWQNYRDEIARQRRLPWYLRTMEQLQRPADLPAVYEKKPNPFGMDISNGDAAAKNNQGK